MTNDLRNMKTWRPHLDLERLSAALAEEIIAMPDAELRNVLAGMAYPIATAQEVREMLAAASGEPGTVVTLVGSDGQRRIFVAL